MSYTTERTIRLSSLVMAVLVASTLNGSLLWKMDDIAHTAAAAQSAPVVVELEPVTIVGHRS